MKMAEKRRNAINLFVFVNSISVSNQMEISRLVTEANKKITAVIDFGRIASGEKKSKLVGG